MNTYKNPFEFDMAMVPVAQYMSQRGILINKELQANLLDDATKKWEERQRELDDLVGYHVNVFANPTMHKLFYGGELGNVRKRTNRKTKRPTLDDDALRAIVADFRFQATTKKRPETIREWERRAQIGQLVLSVRTIRTQISRYLSSKTDEDGRSRTILTPGATETGRWAAHSTPWGTGLNRQTVPDELREMFVPDPGCMFGEWDLKAGESWVYSYRAKERTMMQILREGGDLHRNSACAIAPVFGISVTPETWHTLEPTTQKWLRFLGKKSNHALSYRMGPAVFAATINEEGESTGIFVTQSQADKIRMAWLQEYWAIPAWWSRIEAELDRTRTIITAYGRVRRFYGIWGDELFKEATAHEPQSVSHDHLDIGILRAWNDDFRYDLDIQFLHENHDSLLTQFPIKYEAEAVACISAALSGHYVQIGDEEPLSIPTEHKVGMNWAFTERKDAKATGLVTSI